MALKFPAELPAINLLRSNGYNIQELPNNYQGALQIAILNLMPMKETTEVDFARLLSTSPLPLEITLMKLDTHISKHTSEQHMERYYKGFDELKNKKFDGFIITGAPVEKLEYEDVTYWNELCEIFRWTQTNIKSTLFICWAAQAALYYKFGIPKYLLKEKMFGIFPHTIVNREIELFNGFDNEFYVPHSRHTEIRSEDILSDPRIELLSQSKESGVYLVGEKNSLNFFITGHSEYATNTLDGEYKRDIAKGLPIDKPKNYYQNDNPDLEPQNLWESHASLLFNNWLNSYVKP